MKRLERKVIAKNSVETILVLKFSSRSFQFHPAAKGEFVVGKCRSRYTTVWYSSRFRSTVKSNADDKQSGKQFTAILRCSTIDREEKKLGRTTTKPRNFRSCALMNKFPTRVHKLRDLSLLNSTQLWPIRFEGPRQLIGSSVIVTSKDALYVKSSLLRAYSRYLRIRGCHR